MEGGKVKVEVDDSKTVYEESVGATNNTNVDAAIGSSSSLASTPYSLGEKVIAFHNNLVYVAKVQKLEFRMNEWQYLVHYLGWNKNWDEWVGLDRLMKYTEENLQKHQVHGNGSGNRPRNTSVSRRKKRKNTSATEVKDSEMSEQEMLFHIPSTLKKQLIDDCVSITGFGQLLQLPRNPNVNTIMDKYKQYRLKKANKITGSEKELVDGLLCYFNKALFAMLLYNDECEQYEEAIPNNISPSSVYGAEHLLRLFVKLPEILFHVKTEEKTWNELGRSLQDFVDFLEENQESFFVQYYHVYSDDESCDYKD